VISRRRLLGLALLVLVEAGCQGTDPLAVQDNPAGDRMLMHVLIGPADTGSQAVCAGPSLSDSCDADSADILIVDYAKIDDVAKWLDEGPSLAKQYVYTSEIGDDAGPVTLSVAYDAKAHEISKTRTAVAGARLANLIIAFLK
jgi:hypothetical protein